MRRIDRIKKSGIRELFEKATEKKDLINLGIGEPDLKVPDLIKKEIINKDIIRIANLIFLYFLKKLESLTITINEKAKKNEPATSSSPKKLAILPGMQDFNPIVLKPKIISKTMSTTKTEKIIDQKPYIIFSNSD